MNPLLLTSMAAVSTSVGGYCAVLLQRRAHRVGNRAAGRVSASFLIVHSTLDGTAIFAASTPGDAQTAVWSCPLDSSAFC